MRYFSNLQGKAKDYVNVRYYIDTINKVYSYSADFDNVVTKKTETAIEKLLQFSVDATGIDSIRFRPDYRLVEQGTDYYLDDICVRKIDQPYIEQTSPAENETDVDIYSKIIVQFSEALDKTTVTNETLYIKDENGKEIPAFIKTLNENGKTVSTIEPNEPLEYEKTYTLCAGLGIFNGNYNLKQPYEIKFKTRPLSLEYAAALTDSETGKEIKKLTDAKGKKVKVTLNIRNFAGAENEPYFVGAALTDTSTGRQIAYAHSEGIIAKGENAEVISKEFSIPANATDDYKINLYIWNAAENRSVLTDIIVLP